MPFFRPRRTAALPFSMQGVIFAMITSPSRKEGWPMRTLANGRISGAVNAPESASREGIGAKVTLASGGRKSADGLGGFNWQISANDASAQPSGTLFDI